MARTPRRKHKPKSSAVALPDFSLHGSLNHSPTPGDLAFQLAQHRWRVCASALIGRAERTIYLQEKQGIATTRAQLRQLDKLRAGSKLLVRLPLYSIAAVLETSEQEVLDSPCSTIVHFMVEKVCGFWGPSTISDASHALDKLSSWLRGRNICAKQGVTGLQIAQFLEDVEAQARDNCNLKMANRDPASTSRILTGNTVAPSIKRSLIFLANHFRIRVAASSKIFELSAPPVKAPSTPSESLPVAVVAKLELAATDLSVPAFARVACAFFTFMALACLRFEQAQGFRFGAEIPGCRCLEGHIVRDKHPDPAKQGMRPVYFPISGLISSSYLLTLTASLEGVGTGDFLLRDTDSPSGDPFQASKFLFKPMSHGRALVALRSVLTSVCGLTKAQAQRFGTHSPRHFLPEIALSRGLSVEDRCELGRWSGSSSQDADLLPSERDAMAWRKRHAHMPDLYAPKAKVVRVCHIVVDQIRAARVVLNKNPPLLGGWDMF